MKQHLFERAGGFKCDGRWVSVECERPRYSTTKQVPAQSFARAWSTQLDVGEKNPVSEIHLRNDAVFLYTGPRGLRRESDERAVDVLQPRDVGQDRALAAGGPAGSGGLSDERCAGDIQPAAVGRW